MNIVALFVGCLFVAVNGFTFGGQNSQAFGHGMQSPHVQNLLQLAQKFDPGVRNEISTENIRQKCANKGALDLKWNKVRGTARQNIEKNGFKYTFEFSTDPATMETRVRYYGTSVKKPNAEPVCGEIIPKYLKTVKVNSIEDVKKICKKNKSIKWTPLHNKNIETFTNNMNNVQVYLEYVIDKRTNKMKMRFYGMPYVQNGKSWAVCGQL